MRTRKLKTISTESKDRYMIKIQSSKNIYAPPSSPPKQKRRNERQNRKLDSIDKIVSKIDEQDDDKYRTPAIDNDLSTLSSHPTDTEQPQEILSGLSSALSSNLESNGTGSASHISLLSSGYTTDQQSQTELGMFSADSEDPAKVQAREVNELYQMLDDDDDDRTQQRLSYISITICSFQVLILALQLSLCGVAWCIPRCYFRLGREKSLSNEIRRMVALDYTCVLARRCAAVYCQCCSSATYMRILRTRMGLDFICMDLRYLRSWLYYCE